MLKFLNFNQCIDWTAWKIYFIKNWFNYTLWKTKILLITRNVIGLSLGGWLIMLLVTSPIGDSQVVKYLMCIFDLIYLTSDSNSKKNLLSFLIF